MVYAVVKDRGNSNYLSQRLHAIARLLCYLENIVVNGCKKLMCLKVESKKVVISLEKQQLSVVVKSFYQYDSYCVVVILFKTQ